LNLYYHRKLADSFKPNSNSSFCSKRYSDNYQYFNDIFAIWFCLMTLQMTKYWLNVYQLQTNHNPTLADKKMTLKKLFFSKFLSIFSFIWSLDHIWCHLSISVEKPIQLYFIFFQIFWKETWNIVWEFQLNVFLSRNC